MPPKRRETLAGQIKTADGENMAVCAAEARNLKETLQVLSLKREQKLKKLLAQGQKTISTLNETNRSAFNERLSEYKSICETMFEKADLFSSKLMVIVAQKEQQGGKGSDDDEANIQKSREMLVQDGYLPEELEVMIEKIGEAWELKRAAAKDEMSPLQGASQSSQGRQEKPRLINELRPLDKFELHMGLANFKRWKETSTNFANASHVEEWRPEIQRQVFESLLTEDSRDHVDLSECLSFDACMLEIQAHWNSRWNKETLLNGFYESQIERGEPLKDYMKRMLDLAREAGIGEASEEDHVRSKVYKALSKEQKSNLVAFMPTNASLSEVMAQLDQIELWSQMGNDKDFGKVKCNKCRDYSRCHRLNGDFFKDIKEEVGKMMRRC